MANNLTLEEWVDRAKTLYLQNAPNDISDLEKQNSIALAKVQGILAYELGVFANNISKSIFFDSAPNVDLLRNAAVFGFFLREGFFAKGDVLITGTAGHTVLINTEFRSEETKLYNTTQEVILNELGEGTVEVSAKIIGIGENIASGNLELVTENSNINSIVIGASGIIGGQNTETIEEFRSRIIVGNSNIATFGKRGDYILWAKEASSSVTRAWEDRNADNIGTLNVYLYNDNGIISEADITAAQTNIDSNQSKEEFPTKVLAAEADIIDLTLSIDSDTPANRQIITDLLEKYLLDNATVGYPNFEITNSLLLSATASAGLTSVTFLNPISSGEPSFTFDRNKLAFFNLIFQ